MKIISYLSEDQSRRVPAVNRDLFEPIGEMIVNFALLEHDLQYGIHLLLYPGQWGYSVDLSSMVTSEMSFRRMVDLFQCLVQSRCSEADYERCKAICASLFQVEAKRNVIVHSQWATRARHDSEDRPTIRVKTTAKGKGLRRDEVIITKGEIVAIANEIGELAKVLGDFIAKK